MTVKAFCASHTPLKDFHSPGAEAQQEVDQCFADLRAWIADFAPELVIVLGPDHFNGFFYQLMPSFCVGTAVESVGDWNTPGGALPVDAEAAEALVKFVHAKGVDTAISHRMAVDHGLTQTLNLTFEWSKLPPLVPVFINCAAPPCPPFARVIALGRAIGEFARATGKRVLIIGSGGLSHDPPLPSLETAAPEVRERIIAGGKLVRDARAARQARVIEEGSRQAAGQSAQVPLNPTWDRAFIDMLSVPDFQKIAAFEDAALAHAAGRGGHEVRTWVATAAAMSMIPNTRATLRMYRAIPIWIAGFGVMTFE